MEALKLENLSPEAREELMKQAEEAVEQKKATKKSERKKFKEIVSEEVEMLFGIMLQHVADMKRAKIDIYNSLQTLIKSKLEVFEVEGDQKTHTFTSLDGSKRITIGYRDISDWDGNESAGIEKVKSYIASLAADKEKGKAANYLQALLKPDRAGKLDPRRIMEMQKTAEEQNDIELLDGVSIIMNSYKLVKTAPTLTVEQRTESGKWRNIELDFSDVSVVSEAKSEEVAA